MNGHVLDTPGFALGAADQVSSALWRAAIGSSFTQPQFLTLTGLYHSPGVGHYDLADRIGIDRATIGPILKRLMDQGLVERGKDSNDSRRAILRLYPDALKILEDMVPLVRQIGLELMSPLSRSEQAAVVLSWATLGHGLALKPASQRAPDSGISPSVPPLAHYPWFFLRLACRQYRQVWRDFCGDGLSAAQFVLMDIVARQPGIDIRSSALKGLIEESNAVRTVMRLVRTRLMRDPRDPLDARRSLLSLTPPGQRQHQEIANKIGEIQHALCQELPPLAVEEFLRLTRLVARLDNAAEG
ncbi:MarR family transcriptional regulator [Acerihabitans sp. KWT182]|uniref:MarR family transcriptional regulator n=1 Tax=Acerihabitans sp. KWT182 TaxID=3157919 RepID=A0AAU7Q5Z6_9GAMM